MIPRLLSDRCECNNAASLSAGTDKNQTYLSLGTTNAKGIIHNNDYERYNVTVRNVAKMLKDVLTLDLSFMLSSVKRTKYDLSGLYYNPLVPLYLFPAEMISPKYRHISGMIRNEIY